MSDQPDAARAASRAPEAPRAATQGAAMSQAAAMSQQAAAEQQTVEEIPLHTLLERVQRMKAQGWRLVHACCTRLVADQEVSYSFDRGGNTGAPGREDRALGRASNTPASADPARFHTLRVRLPMVEPELPSISSFYWSAFLYENEMHDLFGVNVKGMAVDFHGKLYTMAVPTPYARKDIREGNPHGSA
jgi:ech hydrogenase subunit D